MDRFTALVEYQASAAWAAAPLCTVIIVPECGDLQRRILQSGEARALLSTFRETGVGIIREMCKYLLINILMSSLVCTKDPFPFNFFLSLKLSWLVSILL